MLRVRQDWSDELDDMRRQMERFLEHFTTCKRSPVMFSTGIWQPLMDVYETPDEVVVVAELAGVDLNELNLILHNKTLLLTGERRDKHAGKPRSYQLMEVNYGRFQRAIELPTAVEAESANARLENGFLVIVIKKSTKPTMQKVPIRIGDVAGERRE
jgi:HSP20 family protein